MGGGAGGGVGDDALLGAATAEVPDELADDAEDCSEWEHAASRAAAAATAARRGSAITGEPPGLGTAAVVLSLRPTGTGARHCFGTRSAMAKTNFATSLPPTER